MEALTLIQIGFSWFVYAVNLLIAVAGLAGAFTALTTRGDAFDAADRLPKFAWAGMLVVSALVTGGSMGAGGMFSLVGMAIIGIYWCDVYPNIKDVLSGRYRSW